MSTLLQERHQSSTPPQLRNRAPVRPAAPRAPARSGPAAAAADRPIEAPHAGWRLMLGSIVATLREWRRRSVARSELARLDTRPLRDIGVDPGVVEYEVSQSFWRPHRNWRD
jgi:uncharacterized protein YjiS (DUF1127 family)